MKSGHNILLGGEQRYIVMRMSCTLVSILLTVTLAFFSHSHAFWDLRREADVSPSFLCNK